MTDTAKPLGSGTSGPSDASTATLEVGPEQDAVPIRRYWSDHDLRRGRPGIVGYTVVAALVGIALALYFSLAKDLGTRGNWFVTGEVTGIAAGVLLAVAGILAARVRPLEWLFGDTTKVYVAHGVLGLLMLALVTVHPLLYVVGALPQPSQAGEIIVPFHLVFLDWISWFAIFVAMLPTLYVKLRFDVWRYTHLLLAGAVVLTMVSLLITSTSFDTVKITPLRIYLFVVYGLAIAGIAYAAIGRRITEPKLEYRITRADADEAAKAIEITLDPVGRPLRYRAGQFTYVDFVDDRVPVDREYGSHPFSISAAPDPSGRLQFIVQAAGNYTDRVQRINAGDPAFALVHGAYGRLGQAAASPHKQVWLGGGIGITPFLALVDAISEAPADPAVGGPDVVLVVCVEEWAQAFYRERLERCAALCGRLTVHVWAACDHGRIDVDAVQRFVPDLAERVVLLSGPPPFVADLSKQLRRHRVQPRHIVSEVSIGPPRNWRYGSPALRVLRVLVSVEMVVFLGGAIAATIARAL